MSSLPPLTTLICQGFFNGNSESLIGVDFQFFNLNSAFKGIKSIPTGFHILHYSANSNSIKQGICFFASPGIINAEYSSQVEDLKLEKLVNVEEQDLEFVSKHYQFMISYNNIMKESTDYNVWKSYLSNHITEPLLRRIIQPPKISKIETNNPSFKISTVMSSIEDNETLLREYNRANRSTNHKLFTLIDDHESVLNYVPIELKITYRPNASNEEKTKDYFDKSWYFENVLLTSKGYRSIFDFIGEFQFSYLMVLIFGNFPSSIQYNKMLKIFLSSNEFLLRHLNDFLKFLGILLRQLELLPIDYFNLDDNIDDSTNMISMKIIVKGIQTMSQLIKNISNDQIFIKKNLEKSLDKLKNLLVNKFDNTLPELREVIEEDEEEEAKDDNFKLLSRLRSHYYDYDEDDEYAPAIVNI